MHPGHRASRRDGAHRAPHQRPTLMPDLAAKWFHQGRTKPVRLLVVHCTVGSEGATAAEGVAAYFHRGERRASTHLVVDRNSVISCVDDNDTAFGAAGA